MRRLMLGAGLAAGLSFAAAGGAAAQGVGIGGFSGYGAGGCPASTVAASSTCSGGFPGYGVPGYGFPFYGGGGFGGYPYGLVPGQVPGITGAPGFSAVPDPGPLGVPPSYYYPYGAVAGQPFYGVQSGIGFTYNSLNYAPFDTVSYSNTSTVPNPFAPSGLRTSLTILPLSAAGRISVVPTGISNYVNQVIIR